MTGSLDRGAAAGCLLLVGATLSGCLAVALFVGLVWLIMWQPGLVTLVALVAVLHWAMMRR